MPLQIILPESVTISGHRIYPDRAQLYNGLDKIYARTYYYGGASGVDTDALVYNAEIRPESVHHVVVPNRVRDQPVKAQNAIKKHATLITELKNRGSNRYQIRNQYMIDRSRQLHAFYDDRGRGGTYNTMEYAKLRGKEIKVHHMVEVDFNRIRSLNRYQLSSWLKAQKRQQMPMMSFKGEVVGAVSSLHGFNVSDLLNDLSIPPCPSLELWFDLPLD